MNVTTIWHPMLPSTTIKHKVEAMAIVEVLKATSSRYILWGGPYKYLFTTKYKTLKINNGYDDGPILLFSSLS
jgi:hypothetical protein